MTGLRKNTAKALSPLARVHVGAARIFAHWVFLAGMRSKVLGPPPAVVRPFLWLRHKWRTLQQTYSGVYAEQCLRAYSGALPEHYSRGGLAYRDLNEASLERKKEAYAATTSRVSDLIERYPLTLPYKDGESFLDAGCGKGQNIRGLLHHYPQSRIQAFDVNEAALDVIRAGLGPTEKVETRQGSLTDRRFLASLPTGSVDHVIVSHVLSFLTGPGIVETQALRQGIIDELMRIAGRSVLILDNITVDYRASQPRVYLEQRNRLIYDEPLQRYWEPYRGQGELLHLFNDSDSGLLFVRTK